MARLMFWLWPMAMALFVACGGGGASIPAPLSVIATPGTLAISSHAEGASNGRYEITFTGSCMTDGSTLSASAINATIVSSSCVNGALSVTARYTGNMESAGTWYVILSQGGTTGSRSVAHTNPCPTNYVFVPANSSLGVADFCMGKWHVSGSVGTPTFTGGNMPLTNVTEVQAASVCTAQVPAQRLMSNSEWQAMARSIESEARNWSGGAVGSGAINQGHVFEGGGSRASSSDDNNSCVNVTPTGACSLTSWDAERRIHYLATGSVVWDVGGNATNWVTGSYTSAIVDGTPAYTLAGADKTSYGPSGTYGADPSMGQKTTTAASTGITRGGYDSVAAGGGIFGLRVVTNGTSAGARGFRCTVDPTF